MSVAPSFDNPSPKTRNSRASKRAGNFSANNQKKSSENVVQFKRPSVPNELRAIAFLEKVSSVLVFGLILSTLGIYASAVYAPKLWSKEYRKFEKLQQDERNLLANNASLRNNIATDSQASEQELASAHPFQLIFLKPTSVNLPDINTQPISANNTSKVLQDSQLPLSY